jgi:tryptophan 2,3-dioxygenase
MAIEAKSLRMWLSLRVETVERVIATFEGTAGTSDNL